MESFSCKRPKPFFCDKALAEALGEASEILDPAARDAAMRGLARRYQEAAPALFLVEQVDIWAYRPDLSGVALANRVPGWDHLTLAREVRR
jgi:peptide/nickel transport system substrate-binding protein